jgi:hypothetical protein
MAPFLAGARMANTQATTPKLTKLMYNCRGADGNRTRLGDVRGAPGDHCLSPIGAPELQPGGSLFSSYAKS